MTQLHIRSNNGETAIGYLRIAYFGVKLGFQIMSRYARNLTRAGCAIGPSGCPIEGRPTDARTWSSPPADSLTQLCFIRMVRYNSH